MLTGGGGGFTLKCSHCFTGIALAAWALALGAIFCMTTHVGPKGLQHFFMRDICSMKSAHAIHENYNEPDHSHPASSTHHGEDPSLWVYIRKKISVMQTPNFWKTTSFGNLTISWCLCIHACFIDWKKTAAVNRIHVKRAFALLI